MNLRAILVKIADSYFVIVVSSLFIGVAFAEKAIALAPYATLFLGIIFFFNSLKINMKEVLAYLHDKRMLFVVNVFMLLLLPLLVYFATSYIFPALAVAFLVLASMPSGMTSPLLSELSGGKQDLALVITVSTSLLAPFTVPLLIESLAGSSVDVGFSTMFLSLAKVIFVPFFLAQFVKRFAEKGIEKVKFSFKPVSVILLALLIVGIVAKQADAIIDGLYGGLAVSYLVALFIVFIIFHVLGYYAVFWRGKEDRITVTICLTYMNFTLAIYLADKFFTEPNVVVPIILSVIPWALLLMPFKWVMKRVEAQGV